MKHDHAPRVWAGYDLSPLVVPFAPPSNRPRWQEQGACLDHNPELFYPERESGKMSSLPAKRICADCPVRIECLNTALRRHEQYGVWGGLSERERRRLERMAV